MSSVTHATFVIERTYDAAPERVFAAFAQKELKAKWFGEPEGWRVTQWDLDFRVGGREINAGSPVAGGAVHLFDARFLDIVDGQRIIYSYDMVVGDVKLSVSLTTVELFAVEPSPARKSEGRGEGKSKATRTRLVLTEHGAFLDGHEDPRLREEGMRGVLELLAQAL